MDAICYVCNEQPTSLCRNFTEIKSQHTQVPISQFIRKFLRGFRSVRDIDDESNCICVECLRQIDHYDLMCQQLAEQEAKLRNLLLGTETTFMEIKQEPSDKNYADVVSTSSAAEIDPIAIKAKPAIETVKSNASLKTVPAPKTMIVHEGGKIVKIHLVKSGSLTVKPIDPATMKNLSIGTLIKSKDGAIHPHKRVFETTVNSTPSTVGTTTESTDNIPVSVPVQPEKLKPKGPIQKTCDVCGKIFENKRQFTLHMDGHKKTCKMCDVRFISVNRLIKHMEWHKKHPGFSCSVCLFELNDKPSYKEHMELHKIKASPFDCVLCGKTFVRKDRLRGHVKYHGAPKVLCDLCGRKFPSRQHLAVHKKIHFDDMPFGCDQCPKRFKWKWKRNMEFHMATHDTQRERPFACTFCDMRFLRVDHCSVHERRHRENTKTESCPFCSATFEHKYHLKQHIQRKHDAEIPTNARDNDKSETNSV